MTIPKDTPALIPPHGGYRELNSYQIVENRPLGNNSFN